MSDTEQEPEATPTEGKEPAAEAVETAEVTEAEAPATGEAAEPEAAPTEGDQSAGDAEAEEAEASTAEGEESSEGESGWPYPHKVDINGYCLPLRPEKNAPAEAFSSGRVVRSPSPPARGGRAQGLSDTPGRRPPRANAGHRLPGCIRQLAAVASSPLRSPLACFGTGGRQHARPRVASARASLTWPSPSASRDGLWTATSFPSGIVKILHGEPDAAPAQQEGAAPGRPPARHSNGRHGQGR